MISDGSELLLLVPRIAGMVGSVVLPVLGAVPDSLMVLFSGLGDNPEEKVSIGVGALAGSTIMLLTIPWFGAVYGGRVNIDPVSKVPIYSCPATFDPISVGRNWEKLYPVNFVHWTLTGVANSSQVMKNAMFMMGSALLYLVIQVPAFFASPWVVTQSALFGFVLCLIFWFKYIHGQYVAAQSLNSVVEEMVTEARVDAIRNREVTLLGAMKSLLQESAAELQIPSLGRVLLADNAAVRQLRSTLQPFFRIYENQGDSGQIGFEEFKTILRDLGVSKNMNVFEMESIFKTADKDGSGNIDFEEFVQLMLLFIREFDVSRSRGQSTPDEQQPVYRRGNLIEQCELEEGEDESVAEELPEDLENLTPEQQQYRIKLRACYLMGIGSILILIFSDPAIEVMSEVAKRTDISPFFVSFILAPLASNASEVIASYNYSLKKTRKTMKVALTTLEGAACMNNTLCLSIFLGIVYFRDLKWKYTAETMAILFVQFAVGLVARKRTVFRLIDAACILALYPLSLLIVEGLKLAGVDQ